MQMRCKYYIHAAIWLPICIKDVTQTLDWPMIRDAMTVIWRNRRDVENGFYFIGTWGENYKNIA